MEKLVIEGGKALHGQIQISGSKNAALPILFAAILLDSPVTYTNVPANLRDIRTTSRLLNILGCRADLVEGQEGMMRVKVGALSPEAPYDLVKTMRASVLVLGPLLARLGEAKVALPGGCAIGARSVDQHIRGLEQMGAVFDLDSGYIVGRCKELRGADITFDMPTVGGTENLLMAASLAKGQTVLRNAACEPEVVDLANFLVACGAQISGIGSDTLHIEGVNALHGCTYNIMPDRIEAGTFMAATAITSGDVLLLGCPTEELSAVISKMRAMGVRFTPEGANLRVQAEREALRPVDIITRPYPGFPTDMQAQLMALLSLVQGSSLMEETIFENRFMHVPELSRMGADIHLSGHQATIRGVKTLRGAPVMASDLRASASLVLAGLAAQGETHVQRIYHLDRGYEGIEHKLSQVGASIRRMPE